MINDRAVNQAIQTIEQSFSESIHALIRTTSFPEIEGPSRKLISDAMLYSLNAGGKRIRPMMLLEMARAYGGEISKTEPFAMAMPFAMAIEMIHTYSLVHDDLPSMDDDDLRRGKPTNHVVFGEDIAILAGDGLLNLASELMIQSAIENAGDIKYLRAMHEIMGASGANGMILGQVADIKSSDATVDLERLDFINGYKTGKLLTAALVAGGILGGADDEEVEKLRSIGKDMGHLFQIVDDLLDVVGDETKLGKRTQIDSKNLKITYPGLIGIEATRAKITEIANRLKDRIHTLQIEPTFLVSLVDFLADRDF